MKKNLLFIVLLVSVLASKAQVIQGFTIVPSNPTSNDQIKILATMSFPSGGCGDHQQFSSVNGTTIAASALHCLGPLTFICNYSDTFSVGQLPAGNYRFIFNVNIGGGPSPCSPGIVPGPTDSVLFVVSQAASINELAEENIIMMYNPSQKKINFQFKKLISKGEVSLFNITGQVLCHAAISSTVHSLSVSTLESGLYIVQVSGENGRLTKRIIIQD